jgi:hypothetical protein
MKASGSLLVVISLVLWFISATMDTTVSSGGTDLGLGYRSPVESVHNIGLMQKQMLYANTAGVLFLAGIIFIGFGYVYDLLEKRLTHNVLPIEKAEPTQISKETYAVQEFKVKFASYTTERLEEMQEKGSDSFVEEALIAVNEILKERTEQ